MKTYTFLTHIYLVSTAICVQNVAKLVEGGHIVAFTWLSVSLRHLLTKKIIQNNLHQLAR